MLVRISNRKLGQRGVAFTELASAMPFLTLLVMGVIDFGRMMSSYVNATQVVHEGVRTSTKMASLEPCVEQGNHGNLGNTPGSQFCNQKMWKNLWTIESEEKCNKLLGGCPKNQWFIQRRMVQLLRLSKLPIDYSPENLSIATTFAGEDGDNTVAATITMRYLNFFSLADGVPMTVTFEAPYLYGGGNGSTAWRQGEMAGRAMADDFGEMVARPDEGDVVGDPGVPFQLDF